MMSAEYYLMDEELKNDIYEARRKVKDFNESITRPEIQAKAKNLFGLFGENSSVTPPFRCDYGYNIHIGNNCYFNFNTSILDVAPVKFGNRILVGPDCGFYPAQHPIDADIRNTYLEFGRPITVEDDVWIGGHSVILGGVTIGKGSVIGAGSVVTKDIPAGVIAFGNPCRVIREITEEDSKYWQKEYENFKKDCGMEDEDI